MGWLRRFAADPGAPSRADLVLFGIPPAFLVTYVLGGLLFASEALPVMIAGLVCAALIADALFRRPPVGDGRS